MSRSTDAKRLEVLRYIVGRHTDPTVTSLMKIAYLADLLALKDGHRITDYDYVRYYYGPFDRKIYTDLDALIRDGVLKSEARWTGTGDGGEYYVFGSNDESFTPSLLNANELKLLDELLGDIKGYGAKTLTEAAYKTKPMKKINATLGGNEHLLETLDLNA